MVQVRRSRIQVIAACAAGIALVVAAVGLRSDGAGPDGDAPARSSGDRAQAADVGETSTTSTTKSDGAEVATDDELRPGADDDAQGHGDDAVTDATPLAAELTDDRLLLLAGCEGAGGCVVSGRIPIDHPQWGPVELVSFGPAAESPMACPRHALVAVDPQGVVLWDSGVGASGCWVGFEPAAAGGTGSQVPGAVDGSGRVFFDWNPGRYNGVSVLSVTEDGFEHYRTLPVDDFVTRFYSAVADDVDGDGTYEITTSLNDCFESCATGTVSDTVFRWLGTDFVPVAPEAPQACGGYWVSSDEGAEDALDDITVVGVSCYEAHGIDGPDLLAEIAGAHDPSSSGSDFSAAGYTCTVNGDAGDTLRYGCKGRGVIRFTRSAGPAPGSAA